jgi:DNA-binding transcriptional regulator YhcF (GntR family)
MLKERTYVAVKRMILAGTLRPGEKLAERDLSRWLKVSHTPLREALSRLVQEGLVENRPRRGHYVRAIDAKSVADLYDLRAVLEKHAVRLAARRFTDADMAALDRLRRPRKYDRDAIGRATPSCRPRPGVSDRRGWCWTSRPAALSDPAGLDRRLCHAALCPVRRSLARPSLTTRCVSASLIPMPMRSSRVSGGCAAPMMES